jgi:hypothetical protein
LSRAVQVLPAPETGDALTDLSDQQLWNAQVLASLACGRAHSSLTRRREQYFCFLERVLKVEADLRGLPSPTSDARTKDLYRA